MDMERYGRVHIDNGLQPNPFMESHTERDGETYVVLFGIKNEFMYYHKANLLL